MSWLVVNQVFKQQHERVEVDGISFELAAGQHIGIAGETGAGKSSLLKLTAGLLQPDRGEVFFKGERVRGPEEQLLPGHSAIAYLSQHFELINHYRVEEFLVLTSLLNAHEAKRLYALCEIDSLLQRKTTQLSGGERQRVALAAALGKKPQLLLLDEPFSNLDSIQKEKIKEVLAGLEKETRLTSLIVSHDATDLLSWADRILLMKAGQLVQQGLPQELYVHPSNAYCAGLLGTYTQVSAEWLATLAEKPEFASGQSIFLRPEQLQIGLDTYTPGAALGTIAAVSYRGAHHLVELWCLGQLVKVATRIQGLEKGMQVSLRVREWIW
ncbi:MAG: ABC transporter ATP-binding protein [Sphingomonadales bacterium]